VSIFVSESRHFSTQGREIMTAMVSAIGSLVDMKMVRNIVDGVVERMRDRHGSTDPALYWATTTFFIVFVFLILPIFAF